jgi:uncharacterized membrane protein YfcA
MCTMVALLGQHDLAAGHGGERQVHHQGWLRASRACEGNGIGAEAATRAAPRSDARRCVGEAERHQSVPGDAFHVVATGAAVVGVADRDRRDTGVAGDRHGPLEADPNRRIGESVGGVDTHGGGRMLLEARRRVTVDLAARRLVGVKGHPRYAVGGEAVGVRGHQRGGHDSCVGFGRVAGDQRGGRQLFEGVQLDPAHARLSTRAATGFQTRVRRVTILSVSRECNERSFSRCYGVRQMTELVTFLPFAILGLLVGVFIGCVGVGGVLLVPGLVYLVGMDVQIAIATCMFSYLFSGAVGAVEYARRGSIAWSMALWLCMGAMPGAYLGAATVSVTSARWLEAIIAALVLFSGIYALVQRPPQGTGRTHPGAASLGIVGAVTGFGSALSGTGGPLVLIPILVSMKLPLLTAVGLSQVIQLPIAALATVGNFQHGEVDVGASLAIAALLVLGVMAGARMAHRLPAGLLKRIVAGVLIAVGVAMVIRIFYSTWIGAQA